MDIPSSLIAQTPKPKGDSRLLVRERDGELTHTDFANLPQLLTPESLLIFNDSKVFPARIITRALGKKMELFLLQQPEKIATDTYRSEALLKPNKAIEIGQKLELDRKVVAEVKAKENRGGHNIFTLHISCASSLQTWLESKAYVPLPPYIKRETPPTVDSPDYRAYQTVYARVSGSVAAPTAGLHFSTSLRQELEQQCINSAYITLHVSAGTFLPIRTENVADHTLLAEKYLLPAETLQAITTARRHHRPIIAVGTTTLRALESFFATSDNRPDTWQETSLYIYPQAKKFQPRVLNALLTNFHQPSSTLFLLVCGLLGRVATEKMYRTAIQQQYRFFSYGDACLLWL